jgi:hypothetical protein
MDSEPKFRKVRLGECDRKFDLEFWQSQTSEARAAAAWELVVLYLERRGRSHEQGLQRSVEKFERRRG